LIISALVRLSGSKHAAYRLAYRLLTPSEHRWMPM
jgi:hypothetical protein